MSVRIVAVGEDALARLLVDAAGSSAARRALGARLDTAAEVLLIDGLAPADRLVAAGFVLAVTRRLVVAPVTDLAHQHPVTVARVAATLSDLHGRRLALAAHDRGDAASRLRLVSRLWESWPLASIVGDAEGGVFVDDAQILRIRDDDFPRMGGPLTLPVDVTDKPPTVLLRPGADAAADAPSGIDLVLDPATLPAFEREAPASALPPPVDLRGARERWGLPPSTPIATGDRAFDGAGRLDQV